MEISYFFDLEMSSFKNLFEEYKTPWDALKNIKEFVKRQSLGKIDCEISPHVYLKNPELIQIGEGTIIEPGAYIEGPVIIGKFCTIRHAAYIRSYSLIDDYSMIGHATEVKHSVILKETKAPHFNYVGDSIVGSRVNLGAGAICANVRLDHKEILVHFNGITVNTGLYKFGAIIGDDSKLGCHTVINPGTMISKKTNSMPSQNLKGFIRHDHKSTVLESIKL